MDNITITYEIGEAVNAPNDCKATTTYKSEDVVAFGTNWEEAKTNAVARCKHIKSLGDPPESETIDLDPPETPPPGKSKEK